MESKPKRFQAIEALVGKELSLSETSITEEEIDSKLASMISDWETKEYARKREAEYPSIQECIHAILDDDLDALQAKRAEIKKKYPKG